MLEAEALAEIDAAFTRQFLAQQPGKQAGEQHAVDDGALEHSAGGEGRIQVQGIEILRQAGEGVHFRCAEAFGQAGLLADGEGAHAVTSSLVPLKMGLSRTLT
ncbi:hypothetical protein D3C78_1648720 [compost metagenome]